MTVTIFVSRAKDFVLSIRKALSSIKSFFSDILPFAVTTTSPRFRRHGCNGLNLALLKAYKLEIEEERSTKVPRGPKLSALLIKSANLIAAFLIPINGFASVLDHSLLTCPRLIHDQTLQNYTSITSSLGTPIHPSVVQVPTLGRLGTTESYPYLVDDRVQIIEQFLGLIELDVREQAIEFITESIYFVKEPRQLTNSFYNTETKKVARRAADIMCADQCNKDERTYLTSQAQIVVDDLIDQQVPRYNFAELKEKLLIGYEGLNSILKHRDENGQPDHEAYKYHYIQLLFEFPGPLMRTPTLEKHFGSTFQLSDFRKRGSHYRNPEHPTRLSDFRFKKALDQHFRTVKESWQKFDHSALLEFRWYDKANLFGMLDRVSDRRHYDIPELEQERLLLLAKYFQSAPLAVARILENNPELASHFCWLMEEMDRATLVRGIDKNVSGLTSYIMPATVIALVVTAPFSSTVFFGGLVLLNIVTLIDVVKRRGDNRKLKKETRFHQRHELPEVATARTLELVNAQRETYHDQQKMIVTILAMEVLFLGFGFGAAHVQGSKLLSKSANQQSDVLVKPFRTRARSKKRGSSLLRGGRSAIARESEFATRRVVEVFARKAGDDYHHAYNQFFRGRELDQISHSAFNITYFLKNAPKDEVRKLLLHSRSTGVGSRVLQADAANELIEQIYVHMNTPAMDDFTVFEIIHTILSEHSLR